MIFLKLHQHLRTLVDLGRAPAPGCSFEYVGAEIVLSPDGSLVETNSFVRVEGTKTITPKISVPAQERTRGIYGKPLWDNAEYILGVAALKENQKVVLDEDGNPIPTQNQLTQQRHDAFRSLHRELAEACSDDALAAINVFLADWDPECFDQVMPRGILTSNIVFRIAGDVDDRGAPRFVHQRPAIASLVEGLGEEMDGDRLCVVTGDRGPCARLQPAVKGVPGAQSSGAKLSSYNFDALNSLGLIEMENSPISSRVSSGAITALNVMLQYGSPEKIRCGDTIYVVWCPRSEDRAQDAAHGVLMDLMGSLGSVQSEGSTELEAQAELARLGSGVAGCDGAIDQAEVCILGLAPNSARIIVRSWSTTTIAEIRYKVLRFESDMSLLDQKRSPRPWRVLAAAAPGSDPKKIDHIPPNTGRELMAAILSGRPYPRVLLNATIARLRCERSPIEATRIAVLKGVLSRMPQETNIPMKLDTTIDDAAYLLGRLFSIIERTQMEARPGIGVTVKDKMMGAACRTPGTIFPTLLRSTLPNLSAIKRSSKPWLATLLEGDIAEVWSRLDGRIPRTLSAAQQARFFAGYYQQSQSRWEKRKKAEGAGEAITEDEQATSPQA